VALARIPYANGRPSTLPVLSRPFAGDAPALVIPVALLIALILVIVRGLDFNRSSQVQASQPAPLLATAAASSNLPTQFTASVQAWAPMIEEWAAMYALPPAWIATVMQIESCGHPSVHSRAGAAGLFQVMPFHFGPSEDPLDVPTNAARGLTYLARSFTLASGQPGPTLAGYNGGHGLIGLPPDQWPQETQRYVGWGTGILADVAAGVTPSPALTAWLDAGGARLCQQAESALGLGGAAPSG
jgi:soluble lytic murein transglycosylase-like protein